MITVASAVEEYLIVKGAGGRRVATLKWYRAMLKPFVAAFGARASDSLTRLEVAKWLMEQNSGSRNTVCDRDTALRAFWSWMQSVYSVESPMRGIPAPGRPDPQPRAISVDDLNALIDACEQIRDIAIFITIADCGLRASEVCNARLTDVDFARRTLRVVGKGDRVRSVPFSRQTEAALVALCKAFAGRSDFLFPRLDGRKLTYWGLRQMARRVSKRAGFTDEIDNLHSIRHFAAIDYLRNGGTLPAISRILGHKSITTTANHYTVYAHDELSEVHEAHTALNSLKEKEGI